MLFSKLRENREIIKMRAYSQMIIYLCLTKLDLALIIHWKHEIWNYLASTTWFILSRFPHQTFSSIIVEAPQMEEV